MSLAHGRVEARLPAKDLARAKRWYAEKLGLLPAEEDSEGNMLGIGQAIK